MTAPITEKRLLDAIAVVSEVIILHGAKYAPLLDRLEQELETLKRYEDPAMRARRHLARAQASARQPSGLAAPSPSQAEPYFR
ncbi:branched-subunit amino acid aminotransferase/4-amino-4-deoxychorismate lyase [Bradyrhizobium elkanii]